MSLSRLFSSVGGRSPASAFAKQHKLLLSSQPPTNQDGSPVNLAVSVDLTQPLPGLARAEYATPQRNGGATASKVTTLSNGLRVASEPKFGQYCTVGVCIDSGSRYEVAYPSGISHFLEKLAFGMTEKFAGRDDIMSRMEKYGGIFDCQTTRDTMLYAASVDSRGLEATVEILGDVVLRPKLLEEELENTKSTVNYELEDAGMRPDQVPLMMEAIHKAAYWNNTLGLAKLCPEANVNGAISQGVLLNYLSHYHTPERMVLAGVGVDHDELVRLAEEHFVRQVSILKT
jgi:processing peptidase subunit alpha